MDNLEDFNSSPVTQYPVERVDNDWSARHVRLRFEMFIAATLFFFLAKGDGLIVNILFIEFSEGVDPKPFIWGAFIFSLFSMVSFFTRSQYEKSLWPKQELTKLREITEFSDDFKKIKIEVQEIKIDKNQNEEFLGQLFSRREEIAGYSVSLNAFMLCLYNLHEENGVNSPVHPKFWSKLVTRFSKLDLYASRLSSRASNVRLEYGKYTSSSYSLDAIPDSYKRNYEKLVAGLNEITDDIEERVRALRKFAIIRWFQTQLLSIYLPALSSIALVSAGCFFALCGVP